MMQKKAPLIPVQWCVKEIFRSLSCHVCINISFVFLQLEKTSHFAIKLPLLENKACIWYHIKCRDILDGDNILLVLVII